MFEEYQRYVLAAYEEKKVAHELSINLLQPTPAKIKTECLATFGGRYRKQDEHVLRGLLGLREDTNGYQSALKKLEADRFKPLSNFLKGNTGTTEEKNIELLAWLIDFEPRPYCHGWLPFPSKVVAGKAAPEKEQKNTVDTSEVGKIVPLTDIEPGEDMPLPISSRKRRSMLIAILTGLLLGGPYCAWFSWFAQNGCMYWAEGQYQETPCSKKWGDTLVVAFDPERLAHFKRILKPDTITPHSLGHLWYVKIDGKVEFYTAPGFHPVHIERRLRPITAYIISKYAPARNTSSH